MPGDASGAGSGGGFGGSSAPGAPGAPPGPGVGSPGGGPSPGGIPIDFRRLESSKQRLALDWHFPVFAPDLSAPVDDGKTSSGRAAVALPRERALLEIKGPDHRPLLVVRECGFCKGTDDALMNRRLNNEKTLLLTKWFHCVKLPNHVLNAEHPFRNLFTAEHPPHLFLCRHDGSGVIEMDGQQTQAQLWAAMEAMIAREYEGDCRTAVRGLLRLLNEYDTLDSQEAEVRVRLEETLDKDGPKSPKVRALQRKLDTFTKERVALEKREATLLALPLKPLPVATPPTDPGQRDG